VPSPLVGKPAPAFSLPRLDAPEQTFSPKDMLGKVWLLNVWASWCVSCRQEHPVLVEWRNASVPLVGLNYKEVRGDGAIDIDKIAAEPRKAWHRTRQRLAAKHGDPYALSVLDLDGRVGIDYGVYGVPETYVIDKAGIIRMKHTGPITPDVFSGKILPLSRSCRNEALADPARAAALLARAGSLIRCTPRKRAAGQDELTEKRLVAFPPSCAAWSARTNRCPAHTPNWPTTCAARSAR
jgi:cytochrome c biogenesis protein CcmG/thiol:disulfide interchange protein DsbE